MSVQAITWALRQRVRSATHKAVLLVLANRMDPTGFGWPSQKLVAQEAQCCERTARKVLADLERDGILERSDRRRKDGSYSTDAVQFSMPLDPADNPTAWDVQLAANPAGGEPAANPAVGKSCRRQTTASPAANPAGLTTFEPNTKKNLKNIGDKAEPQANLPEVLAGYTEAAERCGWVKLREFTETRRAAARAAWKRLGGLDGWQSYLAAAEGQSFLGGASDRGWRMDFDFFVSNRGMTHIIEGKYLTPAERVAMPNNVERERRLMLWRHDRTWHASWGPKPDDLFTVGATP